MNKKIGKLENLSQIFGRPITGQTRQVEHPHIAGSQFDTEEGVSRAI